MLNHSRATAYRQQAFIDILLPAIFPLTFLKFNRNENEDFDWVVVLSFSLTHTKKKPQGISKPFA